MNGEQKLNERLDPLENVVEKLALSLADKPISSHPASDFISFQGKIKEIRWKKLDDSDGRLICNFCKRVGLMQRKKKWAKFKKLNNTAHVMSSMGCYAAKGKLSNPQS